MQDRSLRALGWTALVRRLINDISELTNKQMQLARVEARENLLETVSGAKYLTAAAVLLGTAWICLVVAGILALALVIPGWLAGLLVAVFFGVVGGVLIWIGRRDIVTRPLERTRETLREDVQWLKHRGTSSAK